MKILKKIGMVSLAAFTAFAMYAQDSYSSLKPEFSTNLNFSSGIKNIDENATVDAVPGVSNEYDATINANE